MKPLYSFVKICNQYSLRLYFNQIKLLNAPNFKTGKPTIFVSNHPSAFMDPVVTGGMSKPSVWFMTMASVFNIKLVAWLLDKIQMMPIYRQVDGGNSLEKNEATFNKVFDELHQGNNILIYAESITDETFIRRVKPLKKGAARMVFGAMNKYDWKDDLQVICLGLNYSYPNAFNSDILLNYGETIKVKDYESTYNENPNKAILKLQKKISETLPSLVTQVKEVKHYPFFEQLLALSNKGMNHIAFDKSLTLEQRVSYSQKLAINFNQLDFESEEVKNIQNSTQQYFNYLAQNLIKEDAINEYQNSGINWLKYLLYFLFGLPIFLMGISTCGIPYLITKKIVEKIMKRPVFWNMVKIALGGLILYSYLIPLTTILSINIWDNFFISVAFVLLAPFTGAFAYKYAVKNKHFRELLTIKKLSKTKLFLDQMKSKKRIRTFIQSI